MSPRIAGVSAVVIQAVGCGIVAKGIPFAAELFVQLGQVAMGFKEIGCMLERFLIRRQGRAFSLRILQDHSEIKVGESEFRLGLQRTTITLLRFCKVAEVVIQQS